MSQRYPIVVHTINAATATTTGQPISMKDAVKTSFVFKRTNHGSGSSAFTVEVSADYDPDVNVDPTSATWIAYAKLISNVANTNVQNLTRVASVSLATNTQSTVSMDPEDIYPYIRVVATETTDGTHDAWVIMQNA